MLIIYQSCHAIVKQVDLAGNVGKCVCRLHPSNDRHFCLLPTRRKCRPDSSVTFCYVGQFFGCRRRVGETCCRHTLLFPAAWRKSAIPDTKKVSGTNLCRHDLADSAKSADFWLSGRHVADMSATFPAKQVDSQYK
jgi:hypothetical protein